MSDGCERWWWWRVMATTVNELQCGIEWGGGWGGDVVGEMGW